MKAIKNMPKKNYFIIDVFVFALVVILCQTLYRMRTVADKPFFPTFIMIAKQDATVTQRELSRFFLYLSDLLRPTTPAFKVPVFLTQLDELSAQLALAHHAAANATRYTTEQTAQYQHEITMLLYEVEKAAHEYLKERTSARLLTPNGLSTKITTDYEDAKKGLSLTENARSLFEAMQLMPAHGTLPLTSVEEGLKENEQLLQKLAL
jgi:hypothetical protein